MGTVTGVDYALLWEKMREGDAWREYVAALRAADAATAAEIPYTDGILAFKEKLLKEAIASEGIREDAAAVLRFFKEAARTDD